jgi:hypothetical protein
MLRYTTMGQKGARSGFRDESLEQSSSVEHSIKKLTLTSKKFNFLYETLTETHAISPCEG